MNRFPDIPLCVLVTGGADAVAFGHFVTGLFEAGVPMIQIRDKHLFDEVLVARVEVAVAIARRIAPSRPPLVIVNDHVHVAARAGADGVHVGATDMPVAEARRLLGTGAVVGRTAHSIEEARQAVTDGADYLGIGPCYPSTTKSFATHASRDFLAEAAQLPLPVFAIGGITVDRIGELRAIGIRRVAVAAAITSAEDPAVSARNFIAALE